MKKIFTFIITAVLALSTASSIQASPAYPYPIKYTQPDGSVITIQMHGDEFYSWVTDEDGNEIEMDNNGFYHRVLKPLSASEKQAASFNSPMRVQNADGPQMVQKTGSPHFLIILIEFKDIQFQKSHTQSEFSDMLNKSGYSTLGAIGSVNEYFTDNSEGKFSPIFDVYGPVQVSYNQSEYGQDRGSDHDTGVARALVEACYKLNNDPDTNIDFSIYDTDNNGSVDNIFFYYAGYSQAEGGPATSIWPHKWSVSTSLGSYSSQNIPGTATTYGNARFDGKYLSTYGCTSEFTGSKGTDICGIGTFCHEFSHTLELPDYYDTDYSENGQGDGLFHYSVMSSGNYNSNGRIPPYYTAIDKVKIGWSSWESLTSGTSYTLNESNKMKAYRTILSSSGSDEYFVYEARNGQKWDSPLPTGLLIYHVRESQFSSKGNEYENNPGIYFKAAYPSSLNPPHASEANVPYPGPNNVTAFDNNSPSPATDWSGKWHGDALSDINYNSTKHQVTFTYTKKDPNTKTLSGKVTDYSTGAGISGASIKVDYVGGSKSTTTGSDGYYAMEFEGVSDPSFRISITKSGYFSLENESFTHPGGDYIKNFMLVSTSAATEGIELRRCQEQVSSFPNYGNDGINNWKGVIMFSASDMKPFVGLRITDISFRFGGTKPTAAKAIVYFGTEQALDQVVNNPTPKQYNEIKVTKDLIIPAGKDVYVGYSLENCDDHPFTIDENNKNNNGFYIAANDSNYWSDNSSIGSLLIKFKVSSEPNTPDEKDEMYTLGYSGLNLEPGKTYTRPSSYWSSATKIDLSMAESSDPVKSVTYYFDDTKQSGDSISIEYGTTKGDHTIRAEVTYQSGRTETIIQVIKVQ